MKYFTFLAILLMRSLSAFAGFGNDDEDQDQSAIDQMNHSGLAFRSIGTATTARYLAKLKEGVFYNRKISQAV